MLLYPNLTAANHYQIFPRPDLTSCDAFFWLLTWIRWVEYVHLGRPMADEDFVFPAVGANGVIQPGELLTSDSVQKMLNEAAAGSGIEGKYSTHCFRWGGAQHWFIRVPEEEKWSMDMVRFWGGWAEGEQVRFISFLVEPAFFLTAFFLNTLLDCSATH